MSETRKDFVITDAQLLDFVKEEIEFVESFCIDCQPRAIPPTLKILDSQKRLHLIELEVGKNFHRSAKRREILVKAGEEFYREWGEEIFPEIVMLTSEAWIKAFHQNAVPDKIRQPSDYPDAIDAIAAQAITLGRPSILANGSDARACMAALKIERRKPYIQVTQFTEPTLYKAGRETTDLINHFFIGWAYECGRKRLNN